MKKNITILLTSVGVATGPNVISSLRLAKKLKFKIIGADNDWLAAGLYLCDKKYVVPRVDDPEYIAKLLKICRKERVDILLPLLSKEIIFMAQNKESFEKNCVKLALPDIETIKICGDKNLFVRYLTEHDLPCPKLFSLQQIKNNDFPLFVKPASGSSSRDSFVVNNRQELNKAVKKIKNISIQEYLSGPEFTIDTLGDLAGNFVAGVIRQRLEVKDGKAVKCKTVKDDKLMIELKKLLKKIKIIGPANVQCIKHKGRYKFIEINTRFAAGGLPLSTYAGINLPVLLVELLMGRKITNKFNYKENIYLSRYLTEVFPKK